MTEQLLWLMVRGFIITGTGLTMMLVGLVVIFKLCVIKKPTLPQLRVDDNLWYADSGDNYVEPSVLSILVRVICVFLFVCGLGLVLYNWQTPLHIWLSPESWNLN